MRYLIIALSMLFLVGCVTTPEPKIIIKREVVEVKIPVAADCPKPPHIAQSKIPVDSLTEEDRVDFKKISKSYVNSVLILKKENEKLRTALDSYRHDDK